MRLIDADALKAEWPEPIDWMDREQVLRHITWFRAVIDNMPTIDPVKRGRWIHDGKRFESGNDWWHCSECGYSDVLNRHNLPNYCPNCGARMDGEKE